MLSTRCELADLHCRLNTQPSGRSMPSFHDRLTTKTSDVPLTNLLMILSSSVKQISQNYCENGGIIDRKVLSKLPSAAYTSELFTIKIIYK